MNRTLKLIAYIVLGLIFPFWIILGKSEETKVKSKNIIEVSISDSMLGIFRPNENSSTLNKLLERIVNSNETDQKNQQDVNRTLAMLIQKIGNPTNPISPFPNSGEVIIRIDTGRSNRIPPAISDKKVIYNVPRLLWLTDNFSDTSEVGIANRLLRDRIKQLPIIIDTIQSLDDAVSRLRGDYNYLGIISDVHRKDSPDFGLLFLEELNRLKLTKKIYFFSFSGNESVLQILRRNGFEVNHDVNKAYNFVQNLVDQK